MSFAADPTLDRLVERTRRKLAQARARPVDRFLLGDVYDESVLSEQPIGSLPLQLQWRLTWADDPVSALRWYDAQNHLSSVNMY